MKFGKKDKEQFYILVMDILEDLEKCPPTRNNSIAIDKLQKLKQMIEWL
tara:strand:- start:340 stop:486 length:147 start_codon:yes stop_codon:yes gene_type:complete